jgi:hypothetical protein
MPTVIIVEKSGSIKEVNIKSYNEEELYKKAGFKVTDGFELQTKWTVNLDKKYTVLLYAKVKGRAGQENKYDFPPPVDKNLFFGNCLLVNVSDDNFAQDLKESEWEKIYEHLFGGFEDIGSEDSEESEDSDVDLPRTKSGYVKDGFVVDDNELYDDSEESIEEIIEKPKKATKNKKTETKEKKMNKKKTVFETIESNLNTNDSNTNELNCTTELEEEEYL